MDPRREYASTFLEESLGLARGSVEPENVPTEFVASLAEAVRGAEGARSSEPGLEKTVLRVGDEIVRSMLDSDGFILQKERWPGGAKYAACLTHDVDNITWPISHVLQRRERFSLTTLLLAITGVRDPYDNTSYIVSLEKKRNVRSSFYFLSGSYDVRPKAEELKLICELGWEVGLHGDFGTHDSEAKMTEAVARIKEMTGIVPMGVREHYLKFDFSATWEIMHRAGLAYDTTVGNADTVGFRIGLCNPFHPPDDEWRPLSLLELPLGLMDATLWGYLKRTEEEGIQDFLALKQSVADVNGLFTVLWHPESVRMKGGRVYPQLVDMLLKDGCFVGSGLAMANWWQKRAAPLAKEGDAFRMDDAPAGLVLRFRARGEEVPKVSGGTLRADGAASVINASGGQLRVTTG